jgi:radical SAM superfamily enzyme YgiQ (UPF0313 family)
LEVKAVFISTYELGRQPFGLASPAAWLRARGHTVTCADLSVGTMPSVEVREADLVAVYLPMHTATRLAGPVLRRVRELNPAAHLCCYGLYAPLNEEHLRGLGVQTVIGGEFEAELARLADSLETARSGVFLDRLQFIPPDRARLPVLSRYPKLVLGAEKKRVGYTEASRGCKHLCRHCPVVPVYEGKFRVVQADVVLEDVRRQVAAGAEHITFGDPDFLNGPAHARRIVEALHAEHPALTYDITAKIEHLLAHRELLPVLRDTGCLFVITAVESLDDAVLAKLDKGHSEADFVTTVRLFRECGLTLSPTFIPFTPWTTVAQFGRMLDAIRELGLVEHVAPVQWSLRLLITAKSRLLELEDVRTLVGKFDTEALVYPWRHPDRAVDALAAEVSRIVRAGVTARRSRAEVFDEVWEAAHGRPVPVDFGLMPRTVIPYMEEPWFC